jgi:hypothetical protein
MRIDNGYTEIDIYPLPNGDLDTATIIQHAKVNTITEAAGVSVWYDQSGNGNDAVQAVNASQPLICDNGVVFYESGKPALNLDGADDGFNLTSAVGTSTVKYAFTTHLVDSTDSQWSLFNDGSSSVVPVAESGSTSVAAFGFTITNFYKDGVALSVSNRGDVYNAYQGGINALTTLDLGTTGFIQALFNRVSFVMKGKGQEVIIYDSDQSSNRHKIESNINTYFDIYPQSPTDLLLDKNPDAAAAYSLRKLRRTYAGPAVKVRRASDNVEADVYFDRNNEVSLESRVANVSETTTGSSQGSATFTLAVPTLGEFLGDADYVSGGATDGFVVVWYDQAKSNNAEQLAAANQPKIYDATTGVVTLNGKPSISTLTGQGLTFTAISLNDLSTFIIGNTAANAVMLYGNANATRLFFPSTNYIMSYSGITNGEYTVPAIDTSNSHLRTLLREDGVSESVYYDGSQLTQIVQGGSGQINVDSLGPVRAGDANRVFQEIIIYNSDQSSNRTKIETDINNHYSIYQNTPEGGLLNQYGGAAAAYSLRALDFSYSGPLVRVRRDSDHVEADVYADENGVFSERSFIRNVSETSTGVTVGAPNDSRAFRFGEFAYGANCFVVEWKDQSGSDNHASQNAAADQPKIYDATTGVVTENGKPAIDTMTDLQGMPFTSVIQATNQFIALVGYINNQNIWLGSSDYFGFINNLTTAVRANNISEVYTSPTVSNQTIITYTRNGSESQLYQEGSSLGTSTALSTQVSDYDGIGTYSRAGAANFKMQEIVIYDSDQSNFRTAIEDNINKFYKIY